MEGAAKEEVSRAVDSGISSVVTGEIDHLMDNANSDKSHFYQFVQYFSHNQRLGQQKLPSCYPFIIHIIQQALTNKLMI